MSRARPDSVPADAWWSARDDEWVFGAKDADGKLHGEVTYWRADGTLVNRCAVVDGYHHGPFVRYHPSGEVSREGTLHRGRLVGTDVFHRSTTESPEQFPSGLDARVWRVEVDMTNGRPGERRLFDVQGRPVGEDGEPRPDRPDAVPADAVYCLDTSTWLHGRTVDGVREGPWRFFDRLGWTRREATYDEGQVTRMVVFDDVHASTATLALREGDTSGCASAVAAGLADPASGPVERLVLLALRADSLVVDGAPDRAADVAVEALADAGLSTASGARARSARASLHAVVARHHLQGGRTEEALTRIRTAIAQDPTSNASLHLLLADILHELGRPEERRDALRDALLADDRLSMDASDEVDVAAWLRAVHPDSMTAEGAWAVLGRGGERLVQFCDVVAEQDDRPAPQAPFDPETQQDVVDHPWSLDALPACSPELTRFAALASAIDHNGYRSGHLAACESSLTAAVNQMDTNWLGRIQSIFLPVSAVGFGQESLLVASWAATDAQTSVVYSIHQDDREYVDRHTSLAAMAVEGLDLDEEHHAFLVADLTLQRWDAAATCADKVPPALPPALDLLALEPRTHWIVNLLVGKHPDIMGEIFLGEGIVTAASPEDWQAERGLLQWPHLQAYWLMHHLVFGDRDGLREVLEHADARYPGVAELARVATATLAGEPVDAGFHQEARVIEYRMDALERRPELLTDAARTALERDHKAVFDAAKRATAALDELAADDENDKIVAFLGFLRSASGKHPAYEQALADQDDRDIDYITAMKTGRVTPFEGVYTNMLVLPEAVAKHPPRAQPLLELFEAAVLCGSKSPDDHKSTMPGALLGLGLLTITNAADYDAFHERVMGMPFQPDGFGPYRRLQLAVLAAQHLDTSPTALDFLRGEVERYSAQFSDWGSDTFDYADRILTERGDDRQLQVLADRLAAGSFSGANWKASVRIARHFLAHPWPQAAAGLKTAIESGLGRHDDGDRATVVRAYARCAGDAATADLDAWLADIRDVRRDCELAALLAGRIELDVGTDRLDATLAATHAVLERLDSGSMKVGAAMSLLAAVDDHGLPGFGDATERIASLAEAGTIGNDELRAAIVERATAG